MLDSVWWGVMIKHSWSFAVLQMNLTIKVPLKWTQSHFGSSHRIRADVEQLYCLLELPHGEILSEPDHLRKVLVANCHDNTQYS